MRKLIPPISDKNKISERSIKDIAVGFKSAKQIANYYGLNVSSIYRKAYEEGYSMREVLGKTACTEEYKKERKSKYIKGWYLRNKEKANAYSLLWRSNKRVELINSFGGKCNSCGVDDHRILDFDHINNDGYKEKGGSIVFQVKRSPERFQLLCKNCNWLKEYIRRKNAK